MATRCVLGAISIVLAAAGAASAQEIIVKSADDSAPRSEFLSYPGDSSDPYAPAVDWNRIPPWRKTSFFGMRAQGKTFIYVVDCSGSMSAYNRLERAKREIRRSVAEMQFPQRFHIIFYSDRPRAMPGGGPVGAEFGSKGQFTHWMSTLTADGATDPRLAMAEALSFKPDGIFLLSDGEYPPGTAEAIAKKNTGKIPIHCVDLAGNSADLQTIAKASGGQYASRP